MIPIILGKKTKVRPKDGGQREYRHCPQCDQDADFVEVDVDHTVRAFFKVELFTLEDTAFACSACGELMGLESTGPATKARPSSIGETLMGRMAKRRAARAERRTAREQERLRDSKEKAIDDEIEALRAKIEREKG